MKLRRLALVLGCAALLAWITEAGAENPKLTLDLEKVSAPEAVAALAKTSGVTLRFQERFGDEGASPERQQRRESFHWRNVTLAQALREAGERFGLKFRRSQSGYFLHFAAGVAPALAPLARQEKEGIQVRLRQITTETVRRRGTGEAFSASGYGQMMVTLEAQLPEGEGAALAGLSNVTAKDDRGNVLVADYGRVFSSITSDLFPDEWRGGLTLTGPDPAARKLLWLEGDLMKSVVYEPLKLVVPLPLTETGGKQVIGGIRVEVTRLLPTPAAAGGPVGSTAGPRIEYRLVTAQGVSLYAPNGDHTVAPVLEGASGKRYAAYQTFGGNHRISPEQELVREFQATLPAIDEPLVSASFALVRKEGRERLVHFRFENIPLPGDAPNVPRRVATLENRATPAEQRPLYQRDGGSVISQVLIGKAPARAGVLWLGLAAAGREQSGEVQWYEQPVDGGGIALLSQLKPGRYRLLRIYRPTTPDPTQPAGEWENSEVEIEIKAGKVLEAPAFRFEPGRKKR